MSHHIFFFFHTFINYFKKDGRHLSCGNMGIKAHGNIGIIDGNKLKLLWKENGTLFLEIRDSF